MELPEITSYDEVEKCKRGDASGYTQLYNRYAKEVYNTIFRLVRHTGEAEDLLQETFVAAFQAIHGFEHTGGFRAWVKRIAINRSISWLRKQKVKLVELEISGARIEEDELVDEKAFVMRVEEVKKAIEALPEGYRTVVQLYLFEKIPQEEIGQILGISHNSVRIQYHRAKQKILLTLKKQGHYER